MKYGNVLNGFKFQLFEVLYSFIISTKIKIKNFKWSLKFTWWPPVMIICVGETWSKLFLLCCFLKSVLPKHVDMCINYPKTSRTYTKIQLSENVTFVKRYFCLKSYFRSTSNPIVFEENGENVSGKSLLFFLLKIHLLVSKFTFHFTATF